jgi:anhydro-N-acetylmuramic acid kinase
MSHLYIGLMSGTSADGIDAALVDFSQPQPSLLAHYYKRYNDETRQSILALCKPGPNEIIRLGELEVSLGIQFAQAIIKLLQVSNISSHEIQAVGSHGQTIRHHPEHGFTLQIGDPNIIAARTGITTVADFRRRDIALDGQGAPLVPAFHHAFFADPTKNRSIVNIGGIANVTLLSASSLEPVTGFDTGPGNTLLDSWIEKHTGHAHDEQGALARTGTINDTLLKKLLADDFFHLPLPKSTGREYFNLPWLESYLPSDLKPADVQATLVELTAKSIMDSIKNNFPNGEIFVCGGGIHNLYLMDRLRKLGTGFQITSTEKLGIHPDWVEAMAFAWLAMQTLQKKTGNLTTVTGAKRNSILGGVYYAD